MRNVLFSLRTTGTSQRHCSGDRLRPERLEQLPQNPGLVFPCSLGWNVAFPSSLFPSPLTRCVDQLERRAGPGGSCALLCRQPSCLQRAAVPGSRSKMPLSFPLSTAGALLGVFVTLSAPSHALCPQSCLCWLKCKTLEPVEERDSRKLVGSDCPGMVHVDRLRLGTLCKEGAGTGADISQHLLGKTSTFLCEPWPCKQRGGGRNQGRLVKEETQRRAGELGW